MPETQQPETAEGLGFVALVRRYPHFRRLWLSGVVSYLGDWFNFIALVTLIGNETGSPLAVAFAFVTKALPTALASPLAGVLVDRLDRRRLMIGADVARALVVLGLLLIDGPEDVWLAYVLTFLQMTIGAVFQPAKSASVPNLVEGAKNLVTAGALLSATWSVMLAVGAGLGGLATQLLGPRPVFVLDALTYLLSALFIARAVIPQETEPADEPLMRVAWRKVKGGFVYLWQHPSVGRIALAKATWALGGGGLVLMIALIGEEIRPEAQAAAFGLFFLARGVGTGIGPVVARRALPDPRTWPAALGWSIVLSGITYATLGWAPWSLWLLLPVVGAHAFSGANWVLASVMLQERTPDAVRGRVFANDWLFVTLADTLSLLAAGWLLEAGWLTLRTGFLGFSALMVVLGVLWLATVARRERMEHTSA